MDLDDSELYWTRKQKGLATEKETEEYVRSLEEKIKKLEKYEKYYQAEINLLDSYIPKSLVREKIEKDTYKNEHTILGGRRNGKTLEYGIRLGRIQMCEELLKEGDK